MKNKQDKFINWLCGKGKFPFFQSMPEVEMPIGWRKDAEMESDDKYGNVNLNNGDYFSYERGEENNNEY